MQKESSTVKKSQSKNGFLSTTYLALYNLVSSVAWAYVLFLTLKAASTWTRYEDLYESKNVYSNVRDLLKLLLVTASLEVFHAAFRLVPSNPVIVFIQVFIRFLVVWGVADVFQTSQQNIGVFFVCFAWSASETLRYLYYFLNLANLDIYLAKWCRYNLFIVLYPIGAFSEMIIIAYGSFYIRPTNVRNKYSLLLPNIYNFSYDMFVLFWIWIALYIPIFPIMYQHMLVQRKKCLYSNKDKDSKKKAN